jgi:hypothetical protein
MPRLGLTLNDSFARQPAVKADQYGRRIRHVEGVNVVDERDERPIFSPLFLKATLTLTLLATATVSMAAWSLFTFPH